ncbi:hypothetical protein EES41_39770 (plasmid) [Streptomyces sp. ADI95-16]|uniref:hypothetical protein n=1 Tax=Streptomyces sp. ADI95-16 TaxID=1522758 RepID=UPI000F3A9578|nr:hypothetical protein [Streptomyces sp. ADI95-16]AYV32913.1 hypothetical protein EES41_39770 [Streptomyces sp. ADI95-16]
MTSKRIEEKLANEVRAVARPNVQKKVAQQAITAPVKVSGKAEFGYSNSHSGTHTLDPRMRHIAENLSPHYATPLWQALEDGDEQEAQRIVRE